MPTKQLTLFEILLVEDSDDDAHWTMKTLQRDDIRCHVSRAEDGEQALAILQKKGEYAHAAWPALMLLDLSLPNKSGLELLREIRGCDNSDLKNLPVVILTASKDVAHPIEGHNLGMAAYMIKPVKVEELVAAVKKILSDPNLPQKQRDSLNSVALWGGDYRDA